MTLSACHRTTVAAADSQKGDPNASKPSAQTQAPPSSAAPAQPTPAGQTQPQQQQGQAPEVTIPQGTRLHVRLDQTLDTKRNRAGDQLFATLSRPVVVDGATVIPAETRFTGHVVYAKPSGRFKGRAQLTMCLDTFELNGWTYDIRTAREGRVSGGHKKRNWIFMGGGTGTGAAIGVIGGPVVVAIGAGAGAAAGTTTALITGKKNVYLPVETPLVFTLREAVAVRG